MNELIDLQRYPLHLPDSTQETELVKRCSQQLESEGMFTLPGFIRRAAVENILAGILKKSASDAFTHEREHNIYFRADIDDIRADHPALALQKTMNHTLCGDQLIDNPLNRIYEWSPLASFLAAVMQKPSLYPMDDPLARLNVMTYYHGEALNWHFDRAEFTTTLLLQAPHRGAEFQYRQGLRSEHDPNYKGVARLLKGEDPALKSLQLEPGDLNVFRGRNTAHRVTACEGERARMVAVFAYYDSPGRVFSAAEQLGFYGRSKTAG